MIQFSVGTGDLRALSKLSPLLLLFCWFLLKPLPKSRGPTQNAGLNDSNETYSQVGVGETVTVDVHRDGVLLGLVVVVGGLEVCVFSVRNQRESQTGKPYRRLGG